MKSHPEQKLVGLAVHPTGAHCSRPASGNTREIPAPLILAEIPVRVSR